MNKVPMEDLPDNLVPQDDLPDNVIQGGVEQNVFLDSAKGAVSGLTEIPIAIEKTVAPVVEPIANAISYPFAQGINKLKGKETQSFRDYNQQQSDLQKGLRADYQPQTGLGTASKFIGSLLPTLALPQVNAFKGANLLSKIGNMGLSGAYQGGLIGGVNAVNNDGNIPQELGQGALTGGLVGGGLPIGGAVFEKGIAPLGAYMSGVEQQSLQRALYANQQGRSIFDKNVNVENLSTLGEQVGNAARNIEGKIPYNEMNNDINSALAEYSTSGEINPVADALRGKLNKIQKYLDKYGNKVEMPSGEKLSREEFIKIFDGLTPEELGYNIISGEIPPAVLHDIKQMIYDDVSFDATKGFRRTDKQNEALKQIAGLNNRKLREMSSDYALANDNYSQMAQDLQAKADFQIPLKYKSPYMMARLSAPVFGSFATHNPALLGLELATSPKLNQYTLQLYNQGTKIAPYIPRATVLSTRKSKEKK